MKLIDLLMIIDTESHITIFDTDSWDTIYHGLRGNNNNKNFSMNILAKKVCEVRLKQQVNGNHTIFIKIANC